MSNSIIIILFFCCWHHEANFKLSSRKLYTDWHDNEFPEVSSPDSLLPAASFYQIKETYVFIFSTSTNQIQHWHYALLRPCLVHVTLSHNHIYRTILGQFGLLIVCLKVTKPPESFNSNVPFRGLAPSFTNIVIDRTQM